MRAPPASAKGPCADRTIAPRERARKFLRFIANVILKHMRRTGRRSFLRAAGLAALAPIALAANSDQSVKIAEFDAAGVRKGLTDVPKIKKPEADWKKQLDREQFEVTRHADTERAFTGKYAEFHGDGLFLCVCCQTALFDSRTKFESGAGLPQLLSTNRKPKGTPKAQ